ncbi:MAG: integrase DNA-binding domain-containing protein [Lachnospiraceae bacterium]|nr:integrase DNA-binding domain-containing protein [Lachnospiraceae bacterium]
MADKRKDSNGILLNKGERQMSDGRYRYRYTDNQGGQHDVYSWTLRPEDKTPDGRKSGKSLREQEQDASPDITCHIFRHTFCCWLCEHTDGGADSLKYIQSVMGHTDISTTMNIYAECRKASNDSRHEQLKKIAAQR